MKDCIDNLPKIIKIFKQMLRKYIVRTLNLNIVFCDVRVWYLNMKFTDAYNLIVENSIFNNIQ